MKYDYNALLVLSLVVNFSFTYIKTRTGLFKARLRLPKISENLDFSVIFFGEVF